MFPSGLWRAYWEQEGWGRQEMFELHLAFDQGTVRGFGQDMVGRFIFTGQYDEQGGVVLTKQYLGRHSVRYVGRSTGEGIIQGIWEIPPHWSGPFAMAPVQPATAPDQPIEEIR